MRKEKYLFNILWLSNIIKVVTVSTVYSCQAVQFIGNTVDVFSKIM